MDRVTPVKIDLDTGAQMDCVSFRWAQQAELKPYTRKYPQLLRVAGALSAEAQGAFWVRFTMTDHRGVQREHYRPFLAIDRDPDDAELLLSNGTLREIGISLLLSDEVPWEYQLKREGKPFVRKETIKQFRKRLAKSPQVFSLVMVNPFIQSMMAQAGQLPRHLQEKFSDVFSTHHAESLAPHRGETDLAIDIQEGKHPPYGPLYPLSPAELEALREYLEENLRKGFIRLSKSPAGAPILFVPKHDGTLRLCVDYRGLNGITIKNRYPLPLISEIMDRVSGATWFSKIDLKDAYYRIRIKVGDEWKTAFRTRYGHYEFLVMPMGLTNAPAAFQAYINHALRGLVDRFCIVYLDDILIFSATREEHEQHLEEVCQRLRESELYAKPSKCQFYRHEMEFLGFVISTEGIRMDPERTKMIQEWKEHPPMSFHGLQVFL